MKAQLKRLDLGAVERPGWEMPVHGFVILPERGPAILADSGIGGPDEALAYWRCVNRSIADALAEHDMTPSDIGLVINSHLHFDHCGQNPVFRHAPFYIQRAELDRARVESPELADWYDFMGARFELLDGDAEIVPGVRVISTPGHTLGHQCVVVDTVGGEEVLIGDAAYRLTIFRDRDLAAAGDGQAADAESWQHSLERVDALDPSAVHFCHDTAVHTRG
ncbi:MAG TPA: MBL fold metallo-hydrolase [Candidatus Dormibacteraeota bacterium]